MNKILAFFCAVIIVGCSSIDNGINNSDAGSNNLKSLDTFTFDPLSKIQKVEIPTYYDGLFDTARPYLDEKYPYTYVSKPQAYIIDDEIISFAPWFPVEGRFTVFPTAHYIVITQETESGLVSARFNHEQVIKLLSEEYKITEHTSPFFHYVLEVSPSEQANFVEDIHKKLSRLPSE